MSTLRELARIAARIESDTARRDELIRQARAEVATWEQIRVAAAMSRAGAIKAAARNAGPSRG